MEKQEKIKELYFEYKYNQKEISEILGISNKYVSKVLLKDSRYKEEKEKSQGALAYKQSKQKKIKMTYMEKKEFEEIEDVIMDLETNLSQIEEKMNGVTNFKEIDELSKQRDDLQKQIDEKNERYLYLLELQEQIDNQ